MASKTLQVDYQSTDKDISAKVITSYIPLMDMYVKNLVCERLDEILTPFWLVFLIQIILDF